MFNRFGMVLFITTDVIFLGNFNPTSLAIFVLANSWFILELVFGIGVMFGNQILMTHAVGRGQYKKCGVIWRGGLVNALVIGICLFLLSSIAGIWFGISGAKAEFIEKSADITMIMCAGITGSLLFIVSTNLLEAMRQTKIIIIVIIAGNIFNIIANSLLIDNHGGQGVAFATFMARLLMALFMIGYLVFGPLKQKLAIHLLFWRDRYWYKQAKQSLSLGKWVGFSYSIEGLSVNILYIMAATLSIKEIAIFGALMNYVSLLFVTGLGIASASAIHVGYAHGVQDYYERGKKGYAGITLTLLWGILFLIISIIGADIIAGFYTKFADLSNSIVNLMPIAMILVIVNCTQLTLAQILRNSGNTKRPFMINFTSYIIICLVSAWIMVDYMQWGILALFLSQIIACTIASIVMMSTWLQWHPISWYKSQYK